MGVPLPRQGGGVRGAMVNCDRCELRLARGIVCVRLAIPGLGRLQQRLAVAAHDLERSALGGYERCLPRTRQLLQLQGSLLYADPLFVS